MRRFFPQTLLLAREVVGWGPTHKMLTPDHLLARLGFAGSLEAGERPSAAATVRMTPYELLVEPFVDYEFMRRALVACLALSLGCGPIGVLLVLRRMSLMGDALSHAVLPGAALGFVVAGLSFTAMGLGGLARRPRGGTPGRAPDPCHAVGGGCELRRPLPRGSRGGRPARCYHGSRIDLLHILFGTVLAVVTFRSRHHRRDHDGDADGAALVYRPLGRGVLRSGVFVRCPGWGALVHLVFLGLVVVNLVAGFYCLGALMAVGLMMAPAATARFWARQPLGTQWLVSATVAFASCMSGLILSYHAGVPAGPGIVLMAGGLYLVSMCFGPYDSLRARYLVRSHRQA